MKRRNRLQKYREDAKKGKLDKKESENQNLNLPSKEKDASIRSDSVMEALAIALKRGQKHVVAVGEPEMTFEVPPPSIVFGTVEMVLDLFGVRLCAMSIMNKVTGELVTGFSEHFAECGCDACKRVVALVKKRISGRDELGRKVRNAEEEEKTQAPEKGGESKS